MGIYMSSHAMIGVKFTPTETTKEIKVRGCDHPETEDNFCSVCGKPMWEDTTETIYQIDDIHEEFLEPVSKKLNECFNGFVVAVEQDDECFYIGYGATVEDFEAARIPIFDYKIIKKFLKEVLEEFGVWEQCENTFGLWVVSTGC